MNYFNVKKSKKTALALLFSVFFCVSAFAQQVSVKGTVTDPQGEPIIGAYVTLKGANGVGTVTDYDGNFNLKVPANGTLVFSYAGYKRQEVSVAGKSVVNLKLAEEAIGLDEVVAVGYGSQKAKEITSSVTSVKAENFNKGVSNSPMGLLQGKVAGLNITRTAGGDPTNTGYNIQIRGFSTLDKGAGTAPLYIVDGIPVNNIDNISQEEIASMDVLKDGSAAAIYGTRGTNGVIIITTKRGSNGSSDVQCGKTTVEYSGYLSVATQAGETGMATAQEYKNLATMTNGAANAVDQGAETDWMAALTRTAPITHNHNLAISGATKDFSYRGSVAYKNSEGIAINSNREEMIAKLAADQKTLNGWLNLQYDFSYINYRNDYFCGDFETAATLNPTYPIYNADGSYFIPSGTITRNPVADANQKESYKDGNFFRGSVKATINVKPIKGLKLNGFGAFEEGDNYSYWANSVDYYLADEAGTAGRKTERNLNKLFEGTADYAGQWGGHSLTTVLGTSYQNFMTDKSEMSNGGYASDATKYFRIGEGDASKTKMNISSERSSNTLISFFGRANYNYLEKYLLSASVRREGSSRFGVNNKWGWFPAASAGWRISSEDFMKPITWVNDLKLRFGFGVTGNDLASDLKSKQLLSGQGTMWYNGAWITTYSVAQNDNPDLKWEKKSEYNLGLDYVLLNNRLYGSIEVYKRFTSDLLWEYNVSCPPYQYPVLLSNAGKMESKGLEISVTGVPVKTKDFTWSTAPTIAFNDNVITNLSSPELGINYDALLTGGIGGNGLNSTNTQKMVEGKSVGSFYGYKWTGQYTSNGSLVYEDIDGNGSITAADQTFIGNAQPKFTFGWNNTLNYKNWDFSIFLRGVYGNDVLNCTRWMYAPKSGDNGVSNVYLEQAEAIQNGEGVVRQTKFSDYYLEDGAYIKCENISLGYNVPLKSNKYVQSLRLYVTGQNLFTITGYTGMDPEVNITSVFDPGIDYVSFYPSVRTFLFGVNLTL